jgi:hypothetical protein
MSGVASAMSGMGAALLPVATALLFEELTFGGLVRLLIAPRPGSRKDVAASKGRGRAEHKHSTDQRPICGSPEVLEPRGSGGGR